jgi:hypothetical protein
VQVSRSGTVNSGVQANYSYDKADNRINVTVVGSSLPDFTVSDASATEGSPLSFTVTRGGSTSSSISVNYATSNGTAAAGSDYNANSGTLTFAAGQTTQTIPVTTIDDAAVESAETINLTLSGATGGATISDGQGVGTINDNDVAPTCSGVSFTIASNAAVTEGVNSVFTITKNGTATGSCTVNYATANGTAIAGSDYTPASGTLTFTSAQTSQTVAVTTADDAAVESAETLSMNLSSATGGASVGSPGSATATLNDNGVASPCSGVNFTIASNAAVTEGVNSVFTVTKSGTATGSCAVNYGTANGTAIAGSDYTAKSGTLTFTTAQASQTVAVTTTDDAAIESAETFSMSLSLATGGASVGSPGSATATLNDNDSVCNGVSFAVNDASTVEGVSLVFTVTKAGSTSSSCSVHYATANGSAISPGYYAATSGTLTFTSTQTSKTVTVTTVDNSRVSGNLTMYLNLSSPSAAGSISDSQGIGSIGPSDTGGSGQCYDEGGRPIPCD